MPQQDRQQHVVAEPAPRIRTLHPLQAPRGHPPEPPPARPPTPEERDPSGENLTLGTLCQRPFWVKPVLRRHPSGRDSVAPIPDLPVLVPERAGSVESECGAAAVRRTYLLSPLSRGGASLARFFADVSARCLRMTIYGLPGLYGP